MPFERVRGFSFTRVKAGLPHWVAERLQDFRESYCLVQESGWEAQRQHLPHPRFTLNMHGIRAARHAAAQLHFQIHARTWINSLAKPGNPTVLSL